VEDIYISLQQIQDGPKIGPFLTVYNFGSTWHAAMHHISNGRTFFTQNKTVVQIITLVVAHQWTCWISSERNCI